MKPLPLPPLLTWCVDNFVNRITQLKWLDGPTVLLFVLVSYYNGMQNHIIEILMSVWSACNDIIIYFQRSMAWGLSLPVPLQTGPQLSPSLQWTTYSGCLSIYRCAMNRYLPIRSRLSKCRADSRLVPSQWETSLQSNAVSCWLGTNLEPGL